MFRILVLALFIFLPQFCFAGELKIPAVRTVKGELDAARGHMQGLAVSPDAIYVSHMMGIFKLDRNGKLIKHVNTPIHTGDICYSDGKIYAAVAYYDKARHGKGCIRVYDEDLKEIDKYELDKPSDAVTVMGDYVYFGIGPSPQKSHQINRIAKIKKDFTGKLDIYDVDYGTPTHFGAQTMCNDGEHIYASFYSAAPKGMSLAVFSSDLKVVKTGLTAGSIGMDVEKVPEYPKETILVKTRAIYRYKQKEQPVLAFEFFKYKDGKLIRISPKVKK